MLRNSKNNASVQVSGPVQMGGSTLYTFRRLIQTQNTSHFGSASLAYKEIELHTRVAWRYTKLVNQILRKLATIVVSTSSAIRSLCPPSRRFPSSLVL